VDAYLNIQPHVPTQAGTHTQHDDPLTCLQLALKLEADTRVDDALHFGVRGQTPVMVLLEEGGQLRLLVEIGGTAQLTAGQWAELARAWTQHVDGDHAARPLVLDDTLWLTLTISTRGDQSSWLRLAQRFLAWGSQIKLTVMTPPAGVQ
jgi:hypothetical protein